MFFSVKDREYSKETSYVISIGILKNPKKVLEAFNIHLSNITNYTISNNNSLGIKGLLCLTNKDDNIITLENITFKFIEVISNIYLIHNDSIYTKATCIYNENYIAKTLVYSEDNYNNFITALDIYADTTDYNQSILNNDYNDL